jgi:multiple antibiotic resistance protein
MIALLIPSKLAHARCLGGLVLGLGVFALTAVTSSALAQSVSDASLSEPNVSARKIFIMLFLMLGPIKILVSFVNLTKNAESVLRRRLATRAMLFSLAALALAGLLGRNILENFEISVPVLALTGGLILFLVALRTVLEQSIPQARLKQESISPGTDIALSPLAFPIIVTPYGIAAVIVFATLAQDDMSATLTVASIVLLNPALVSGGDKHRGAFAPSCALSKGHRREAAQPKPGRCCRAARTGRLDCHCRLSLLSRPTHP